MLRSRDTVRTVWWCLMPLPANPQQAICSSLTLTDAAHNTTPSHCLRHSVLDWLRSSVDTCHISPCLRDHHTDIWQSNRQQLKSSYLSSPARALLSHGNGALGKVSLNKRRTPLHHRSPRCQLCWHIMIFIRKTQVRVPENVMTIPRWTGIITTSLLDQGGSLHTREQPFLSVNTRCLARCQRSEGRWKRGKNENRWDSPVALLQLTAFSEHLETDRPLQQAETALLCLLGSWVLKQLPKGSTSQQVRSSKWGLCFSRTKNKSSCRAWLQTRGKWAKSVCSSAAAAGHLTLTAYFLPSCQHLCLELISGTPEKKPATQQPTKNIIRKFPLKQLLNFVIITVPFSLREAVSRRGSPKHCSCCYCCRNRSQVCFGFENLALTSHAHLSLPLHLSNDHHHSAGTCFTHNDPFKNLSYAKKRKLTGGWREVTATSESELCVKKIAISGCCILYISPQNGRTRPQHTCHDNSTKGTAQPQDWVNTSQGLPREGSGGNT